MTVSTTSIKKLHDGNGVTVTFAYDFRILDELHLEVYVDSGAGYVLKTLSTDYSVTGVGDAGGGTVVFVSPPPSGTENILIARQVPLTQLADYVPNDSFPAQTHEDALDKLTMIAQQLVDQSNRGLKAPLSEAADQVFSENAWAARANKYVGFDGSGNLAILAAIDPTLYTVTAFAASLLDDSDADTFATTLLATMTAMTSVDSVNSYLMAYGSVAGAGRKITFQNFLASMAASQVELTQAQLDPTADTMMVSDASAGNALKKVKVRAGRILTYVRQTVLAAALSSAGYANAITTGSGLRPGLSATTTPIVMAFANGYDEAGAVDYCERIAADASDILGADLPTSNTSYIYRTMGSAWGSTLVPPQYGIAFDRTKNVLLNFEGADASTSIIDDFGNTWTAINNAQLDTAQSKFGGSSLLLDGTNDGIQCTEITNLGDGSWTVDGWVRFNALPGAGAYAGLFSAQNAATFGCFFYIFNNAGTYQTHVNLSSNGTSFDIASSSRVTLPSVPVVNTWYHFAITYDALAGKYYTYWGGVKCNEIASTSRVHGGMNLVKFGEETAGDVNGWMDACRLVQACLYPNGTTFTPPSSAPTIADYPVHFFSVPEMKMYEVTGASATAGVNPTMTRRDRLFVAECDTSGAAVTAVRNYAIRGEYTAVHAVTPGVPVNFNHNIGTDLLEMDMQGTKHSYDSTSWTGANSYSWGTLWKAYYWDGATNQTRGTGFALRRSTGILWPGSSGIWALGINGGAFNATFIRTRVKRSF